MPSNRIQLLMFIILFFAGAIRPAFSQNIEIDNEFEYTGEIVTHTTPFGETHLSLIGLFRNTTNFKLNSQHRFSLSLIVTHDGEPSFNRTRDLQTFSNLEAGSRYGIFEAYYNYKGERVELKIGTQDLNSDLLVTTNGLLFAHSSLGLDAVTNINLPAVTYPLTGFGITAKFDLDESVNLRAGILDGRRALDGSFLGISFDLNRDEGLLYLIEPEFSLLNNRLKAKFGTYYHNGLFAEVVGGQVRNNLWGFYSIADWQLSRNEEKDQSFNLFYQVSTTTKAISELDYYIGGGVRLVNYLPMNKKNEIGLALAHASINPDVISNTNRFNIREETVIEANWKIHFSDKFSLQPYFQLILRKDTGSESNNPIVLALRGSIAL